MNNKPKKSDRILAGLLSGQEEVDKKLRHAFELGIRHGQASDRDNLQNICRIDQTTRILATLMRTQKIDLESAMTALELSRSDKELYRRIINSRVKKKTRVSYWNTLVALDYIIIIKSLCLIDFIKFYK